MNKSKLAAAIFGGIFAVILSFTTVFADVALPEGAVKGLPEKLSAMDSSGNLVNSETGEYFFLAENMSFGEIYTKDVQLMNLCDDKAYHIYFNVEPKPESKAGEINLEKDCVCSFYLDGEQFYRGTITGIGNIDLTENVRDLGYYEPGDTHTLTCSIAWVNNPGEYYIDEGHKLVDKTGTWILTPREGKSQINGVIEFKWIFYAAVDENYIPPNTGLLAANGTFWLCCMAVVAVMIAVVFVLLLKKKKRKAKA